MVVRAWILALVALALTSSAGVAGSPALLPGAPPGFTLVRYGPGGGTIWQGRIPNHEVDDPRLADIYLPPGFTPALRYRVVYFLHGFWGAPSSFVDGLHFADAADEQIAQGRARPFIGVMPAGGPFTKTASGEWAGVWEEYLVRDVVPWVDEHLPASTRRRSIAGLSAGGFGAVDIGLRHPELFDTLESWGGYFRPFLDGPFVHASRFELAAHTPTLLVREEARLLRRRDVRIFLSTGRTGHGDVAARWTFAFARELSRLDVRHRLWIMPRGMHRHFWRMQLPAAIDYASPA